MSIRNVIKLLSLALLLMVPLTISAAENSDHHADSPSFRTTKINDHIVMLQGRGGNVALFKGEQGLLMVDDDYKMMSEALKAEVRKHGGLDKLTYIINTHWHADHTQGNLAFGPHAQIVAHDNVRARLLTRQEITLFKKVIEPLPEMALPSITYQRALTLYINGEKVQLIHYPGGHTDGDTVVFFSKSNVVHMGDHLFSGIFPFVDVEHGGNVKQMAANIKSLLPLINEQTKVIPGHGPLSNKADVQAFYDMLIGTTAEVQAMKDKGMTLEQMQQHGLSTQWHEWGNGFLSEDVWIGIIDSSL